MSDDAVVPEKLTAVGPVSLGRKWTQILVVSGPVPRRCGGTGVSPPAMTVIPRFFQCLGSKWNKRTSSHRIKSPQGKYQRKEKSSTTFLRMIIVPVNRQLLLPRRPIEQLGQYLSKVRAARINVKFDWRVKVEAKLTILLGVHAAGNVSS